MIDDGIQFLCDEFLKEEGEFEMQSMSWNDYFAIDNVMIVNEHIGFQCQALDRM